MKEIPLLSPQFYKDLEEIELRFDCKVSAALLDAADCDLKVKDNYRYLSVQYTDTDTEKLQISFLPKGKELVYDKKNTLTSKNIQKGRPSKIALALIDGVVDVEEYVLYNGDTYRFSKASLSINGKIILWKHEFINDPNEDIFLTEDEFVKLTIVKEKSKTMVITPKDYEDFSNNIKSFYSCITDFKIIKGTSIGEMYHRQNYYCLNGKESGTLWSSCMNQMPNYTFNIYNYNPDVCSMLIAVYCDKIVGRALVWQTNKGVLMDRIYTYWDYLVLDFIKYAKTNKWHYKTEQNSSTQDFYLYDEITDTYYIDNCDFTVKLDYIDKYAPYLDTLKYLNKSDKILTNDYLRPFDYELETTSGFLEDNNSVTCTVTGDIIHIDDAIYLEYLSEYAHEDEVVYTYDSEPALYEDVITLHDFSYAFRNDAEVVSVREGYALMGECQYIDREGEWALWNNVTLLYNDEYAYTESDIVEFSPGKYAYADDEMFDDFDEDDLMADLKQINEI